MKKILLACIVVFQLHSVEFEGPFQDEFCLGKFSEKSFHEFAKIYKNRPFKVNIGGLRSVGMYSLWYLINKIQPDVIIESGIHRGQSTWLIEQTAPKAKVIAIDPRLGLRRYISKRVLYTRKDFSQLQLTEARNKRVLCFFDDHQNAYERVKQSHQKGIKYLIFDDNYPPGCNDRHLTLAQCFNMEEHSAKAAELKALIVQYRVMPQIIQAKNTQKTPLHNMKIPALWKDIQSTPEGLTNIMELFMQEAHTYRWMTFVELK